MLRPARLRGEHPPLRTRRLRDRGSGHILADRAGVRQRESGSRLLDRAGVRPRPVRSCSSAASTSTCRPASSGAFCDETIHALLGGFAVALTPVQSAVGARRRDAGNVGRRAAGARPGADGRAAAARDLRTRPRRRVHHVRGDLLRRDVRRIDDVDPAQYARRERIDHDRARRAPHGARGPRRPCALHRRDRLVRGGHARDAGPHVSRRR